MTTTEYTTRARIARNIKVIRLLRNYTQDYVAGQLNMARTTVCAFEMGTFAVKHHNLVKLAEVFELPSAQAIIDLDPDKLLDHLK